MSIAPPRPLGPQLFLKPPNAVLHHLCYLNLATLPPRDRICGHTYSISEVLLRQPERRPQRHDVIACHRLDYTQRIPVRCIRSGLGTLRCPRMPGRSPLLLIPRPSPSVRFQEWLSCSAWMGIRASIILSADFGLQRLGRCRRWSRWEWAAPGTEGSDRQGTGGRDLRVSGGDARAVAIAARLAALEARVPANACRRQPRPPAMPVALRCRCAGRALSPHARGRSGWRAYREHIASIVSIPLLCERRTVQLDPGEHIAPAALMGA